MAGDDSSWVGWCAVCVSGQKARLELDSKVRHVIRPNVERGHRITLYLVMQSGAARFGNSAAPLANRSLTLVDGPYAEYNASRLQRHVARRLGPVTHAGQFGMRVTEASSSPFMADTVWARSMDKKERGLKANIARQQRNLDQFSHLRTCMFLLDADELRVGRHADVVLRLREESVALAPWTMPRAWATRGVTSLQCLGWGGVMDASFAVGRPHAWQVLEGLSADWYLSHGRFGASHRKTFQIPDNSETWLLRLAQLHNVPIQTTSMCALPFVSARYVANATRHMQTLIKPRHHTAATSWRSCFAREDAPCRARIRQAVRTFRQCPSYLCTT